VRERRGALEDHVFEQVGHPRLAVPLVPAADEHGHVHGDGRPRRLGVEQHPRPVGQPVLGHPLDGGDLLLGGGRWGEYEPEQKTRESRSAHGESSVGTKRRAATAGIGRVDRVREARPGRVTQVNRSAGPVQTIPCRRGEARSAAMCQRNRGATPAVAKGYWGGSRSGFKTGARGPVLMAITPHPRRWSVRRPRAGFLMPLVVMALTSGCHFPPGTFHFRKPCSSPRPRCYGWAGESRSGNLRGEMRLIYRWSGEYFGFLSNAGDLFDAAGRYLGWVAANGMVRDAEGAYLGQLLEGGYVIRELNGTTPMRLGPPAPQSGPAPARPRRLAAPAPAPADASGRPGGVPADVVRSRGGLPAVGRGYLIRP